MAVNLSVVGIFFNQSITPASGPGPYTLSSIMKAATSAAAEGQLPNLSAFTYGIDANLDATSFSATYKGQLASKGGKTYPAGQYYLSQNLAGRPSYTVWQYYVFGADKKPINYARLSFTDSSVTVPDGGSIVWRLVSILAGPNSAVSYAMTAREHRTLVQS